MTCFDEDGSNVHSLAALLDSVRDEAQLDNAEQLEQRIREDEREACAALVDAECRQFENMQMVGMIPRIAAAIRARSA